MKMVKQQTEFIKTVLGFMSPQLGTFPHCMLCCHSSKCHLKQTHVPLCTRLLKHTALHFCSVMTVFNSFVFQSAEAQQDRILWTLRNRNSTLIKVNPCEVRCVKIVSLFYENQVKFWSRTVTTCWIIFGIISCLEVQNRFEFCGLANG